LAAGEALAAGRHSMVDRPISEQAQSAVRSEPGIAWAADFAPIRSPGSDIVAMLFAARLHTA